jgi:PAS domain S-box-containing protein
VTAKNHNLLAEAEEALVHHAQLLSIHRDIAEKVNVVDDLDETVGYVLGRIAEFNGWQFGHAFLFSAEDADLLVPISAAYAAAPGQFAAFSEFTARMSWRRGEGLPGRVAERGEPVLSHEAAAGLDDCRAQAAADLGLRSAFGFPNLVESEVVGVLEFFSSESIAARTDLEFESIAVIGVQLGRVVERERSRRALRDHERHLRQMTEQLRDAVWTYELDSRRTTYGNPMFFETLWGLPREALANDAEAWLERVDSGDRGRVARALEELRAGRVFEEEFRLAGAGEDARWIRARMFPITRGEGNVRSVVGTAEDITARKQAEALRSRLEREIREAAEDERQRIARDLHDSLGSLLSALRMRIEVLREDLRAERRPDPEDTETIASLAEEAIARSRTLTRGLSPVGEDPYDLNEALRELAQSVGAHSGMACRFHAAEPVRIDSRQAANQLFRIAQEAMTNAVKHGGGSRIEVELIARDGAVVLAVEDDGRGFGTADGAPADTGRGLGIMEYRARDIGASLAVGRGRGGKGVRVACTWPADHGEPD